MMDEKNKESSNRAVLHLTNMTQIREREARRLSLFSKEWTELIKKKKEAR